MGTATYGLSRPDVCVAGGLKTKLVALAKAENRSLSNLIEKVLKEELARHGVKHSRPKTSS